MILVQSISTRYPYTTLFRSFGIEDGVVVASPKADGDLAGDKARNPALQGLPEHDRLRIEPASLIEQATQSSTAVAVLVDGVLVVNTGDEAVVSDEEERHARCLVDTAALRLDDAILDLVAHPETGPTTDRVCLCHQLDLIREGLAIDLDRQALLEADGDLFVGDLDVFLPERYSHDRVDDVDVLVEELQVFRLVCRTEHVRIGRIGLARCHMELEARAFEVFGHLGAATELVNEALIEPRLVNSQVRVHQEAVPVETLDVVPLVGAAVTPNVDVVFLHRGNKHRASDGAADRRRVEVGDAGGSDRSEERRVGKECRGGRWR